LFRAPSLPLRRIQDRSASAVLGAITAEWAGADRGVGAMMPMHSSYDTPKVWLAVLLTCILAGSGYGLWALIERLAIH
jgi:ABC-type nitrate/sulfonate/bicarbonate transport system permease component